MRDLMAMTARPEVISLAGGLPDTSTFPPDTFAAVAAADRRGVVRQALQYGPTEGLDGDQGVHRRGDGGRGHARRPRGRARHDRRPAGDRPRHEDADRPGRRGDRRGPDLPGRACRSFSAYQADVVQIDMDADGMRVDLLEETLDRLEREGRRPKFIYTVPSFQNPAGVTMSLPRRRRLVEVAHERELLVLEDNPYGLLRYEGDPLPPLLALDGGVYVMYLGTFSKILSPRHPAGLGRGAPAGAREDQPRQAGGRPLHLHAVAADGAGVLRAGRLARLRRLADRASTGAGATRCSTRSPSTSRREAEWTRPGGGLFIWATLPDFIDTTDLLARALRDNVAFVPGEAAYLDGRGRNAMRLNFSGSRRGRHPRGHPADRRGRDRAGRALRHAHGRAEAVELPARRGAGPALKHACRCPSWRRY